MNNTSFRKRLSGNIRNQLLFTMFILITLAMILGFINAEDKIMCLIALLKYIVICILIYSLIMNDYNTLIKNIDEVDNTEESMYYIRTNSYFYCLNKVDDIITVYHFLISKKTGEKKENCKYEYSVNNDLIQIQEATESYVYIKVQNYGCDKLHIHEITTNIHLDILFLIEKSRNDEDCYPEMKHQEGAEK